MTAEIKKEMVFHVPGVLRIIDMAIEKDGQYISQLKGRTLEQLAVKYPGVILGDWDEVHAAHEAMVKTAPVVITKERFIEMLEILPPMHWHHAGDSESFKMCEFYYGNITTIFIRTGKFYYEFMDNARLTHAQILEKIVASISADAQPT